MPKLRNAGTDIGKLIQWVGRKCRNHNPLEELGLAVSARPGATTYKSKHKGEVFTLAEDDTLLVYRAGGRVFAIQARETNEEEFEGKQLEAVGY
ncbi:hypothetical protein [Hyphomicrobium sp.]|uniref:hypothetical protein n=1 Tax=Hyphomicrobium sp. TaxID=82 RepID=UPI001E13AA1D|nr:hypothetical protein [Hyphomicrobium sp.]MBY0560152.1 hypothetical protein [Hyphomicrobium sp.]